MLNRLIDIFSGTFNDEEWNEKRIKVEKGNFNNSFEYHIIGNFYVSSYICPYCGTTMHKTVFPIGKEYPIKISNGKTVNMKRVFTCITCKTFMTAAIDLLSDGILYEAKFQNEDKYVSLFKDMNDKATTQGRPD